MSKPDDGGAAFPQSMSAEGPFGGISMRDWFAGQALAGISAANQYAPQAPNMAAAEAYMLADAMLAERAKREGK